MKNFFRNFASRIARLVLALLLIYACMVFYLVLTERRIAFPRAIKHKEARIAIADTSKVQKVFCEVSEKMLLEGFLSKKNEGPLLLYFPDADEDAAQFMAETEAVKNFQRISYNYRGSGDSKGSPDKESFLEDLEKIQNCAKEYSKSIIYAGRGTGAIAAAKVRNEGSPLLLIDPQISFAKKISSKYKYLFPEFLAQTKISLSNEDIYKNNSLTLILEDRSNQEIAHETFKKEFPTVPTRKREGQTLSEIMDKLIIRE